MMPKSLISLNSSRLPDWAAHFFPWPFAGPFVQLANSVTGSASPQ
jgi:hypothetical protein